MEINITVKSSQYRKDSGLNSDEFVCTGTLTEKGGKTYIRFNEPERENEAPAAVTLKTDGNSVTMIRSGDAQSHFVFKTGEPNISRYITPYGAFIMEVKPHFVRIAHNPQGGKIDLGYTLVINGDDRWENNFNIKYKII